MANETGSEYPLVFLDNLDTLFTDCRSGDPDRAIFCQMSTAIGAVTSLILPIILVVGFIGNGMTTYVYLWKLKSLTRQGVYFAVIAISDNCNLFMTGFMFMFLSKGLPWISGAKLGYFDVNVSEVACRIDTYFRLLVSLTSSSLFLLMVTDRCLSVYFPFRLQRMTAKTAIKASIIVTVVCALLGIPNAVQFKWVQLNGLTVCLFSLTSWESWTFFFYNLVLFYPPILPFLGILVANGFLIVKMKEIATEQAEIRAGQGDTKLTNTVICVVLSVVLIVCSLPTIVSLTTYGVLTLSGIHVSPNLVGLLMRISDFGAILVLVNQSINWTILMWKSAQFRVAFLGSIFCCRNRQSGSDSGLHRAKTTVSRDRVAADSRSVDLEMV